MNQLLCPFLSPVPMISTAWHRPFKLRWFLEMGKKGQIKTCCLLIQSVMFGAYITNEKEITCEWHLAAWQKPAHFLNNLLLTWLLSAANKGIWWSLVRSVAHSLTAAWIGLYGRNTTLGRGDKKGAGPTVKARLIPLLWREHRSSVFSWKAVSQVGTWDFIRGRVQGITRR